jgi:two-component system, NtrC family, response regulator HydG
MDRILIVNGHDPLLQRIETKLKEQFHTFVVDSGNQALDILQREPISIVILNAPLPDYSGTDILQIIHRDIDPLLPVIIRADGGDVQSATNDIPQGTTDFVLPSLSAELLLKRIQKALEQRSLRNRVSTPPSTPVEHEKKFVFASEAMKVVNFEITRLARLGFDVLLEGETGVGKDVIAFQIHHRSPRRDKPFIPIPMRSLSESLIESELFGHEKGAFSGADRARIGKLEAANGGTVYIPEISNVTEAVQLKLLQFVQYKTISRVGQDARTPEKQLDVRIIMATNEHLEDHVSKGRMREDFYHRIAGITLFVPPLRERVEDIELLAKYFLEQYRLAAVGEEYEFAPGAIAALKTHKWPGNVRELENWVKKALSYSKDGVLSVDNFPRSGELKTDAVDCLSCLASNYPELPEYKEADRQFKRAYFEEVLRRAERKISKAASISGITRQGLKKIIDSLSISNE